jgi:hypothetical protein
MVWPKGKPRSEETRRKLAEAYRRHPRRIDPRDRFLTLVDRDGGDDACWTWTGTRAAGRPYFYRRGLSMTAPRAAYLLFRGPIPAGCRVLHACPDRHCVNPRHLVLKAPSG